MLFKSSLYIGSREKPESIALLIVSLADASILKPTICVRGTIIFAAVKSPNSKTFSIMLCSCGSIVPVLLPSAISILISSSDIRDSVKLVESLNGFKRRLEDKLKNFTGQVATFDSHQIGYAARRAQVSA